MEHAPPRTIVPPCPIYSRLAELLWVIFRCIPGSKASNSTCVGSGADAGLVVAPLSRLTSSSRLFSVKIFVCCLSVGLSVCLAGWLSFCLSSCLSVYLSLCLVCLSVCLSVCVLACLPACLPSCLPLYIHRPGRSIQYTLSSMLFNVLPTLLEISESYTLGPPARGHFARSSCASGILMTATFPCSVVVTHSELRVYRWSPQSCRGNPSRCMRRIPPAVERSRLLNAASVGDVGAGVGGGGVCCQHLMCKYQM